MVRLMLEVAQKQTIASRGIEAGAEEQGETRARPRVSVELPLRARGEFSERRTVGKRGGIQAVSQLSRRVEKANSYCIPRENGESRYPSSVPSSVPAAVPALLT